MVKIGYALSSEENNSVRLVELAEKAEKVGFDFAFVSDHFHPWVERQGESPFVWSVLGAIAKVTNKMDIGTGVTCPIIRTHPAIIAHAAATTNQLFDGRFILGIGTGENLNEHVIGEGWPPIGIRQRMLVEAIEIFELLWTGEMQSYEGVFYTVEDAKIYTMPKERPRIGIAASGPGSAEIAGKYGDSLISTSPDEEVVSAFNDNGGAGKPKYAQITVSYNKDKRKAIETAHEWWPNAGLRGQLSQELRIPAYFEAATKTVREADIESSIVCGAEKDKYLEIIKKYTDAGFDHIYIHQVGPDQESFFGFCENELFPEFK